MIPKIIHQIWIGPKLEPGEWMRTWREKNPKMKHLVWREKEINKFNLENRKLYDEYYLGGEFHGAADVARVEILRKFGGVYVDADSMCLESIQDEDFMRGDFFAAYEHENHPGRIANGVIGSIPGHPILREYAKRIGESKDIRPVWKTIGGTMFTEVIENYGKENITILPACSFWPENWNGQRAPITGKVYAEQFWGTTKHLYKHAIL